MKKILLVLVSLAVLGFNGCCIYDYGCATVEMIDTVSESIGKAYVETQTGEEFDDENYVDEEEDSESDTIEE